jgi:hypothetical protein
LKALPSLTHALPLPIAPVRQTQPAEGRDREALASYMGPSQLQTVTGRLLCLLRPSQLLAI